MIGCACDDAVKRIWIAKGIIKGEKRVNKYAFRSARTPRSATPL